VTSVGPRPASRRTARLRQRHHALEAGAGLLIDCGTWPDREDFTSRFITYRHQHHRWFHPAGQHRLGSRFHRTQHRPDAGQQR